MHAHEPLTDDELTTWLRAAMAASHNLPGRADLFMAGVCAERLVDLFRLADLSVVRGHDHERAI